jgi:hypothetical protein
MRKIFWLLMIAVAPVAGPAQEVTIDFSSAGYDAGGSLPAVPAVLRVAPTGGDDTALLQAAIDEVGRQPVAANGFRGAALLTAGEYRVVGQLRLAVSGVVLRGMGDGSKILATGQSRRSLIVLGAASPPATGESAPVTADAPAGATVIAVEDARRFSVGGRIIVHRPSTKEWIAALGMDQFRGNFANQRTDWLPGSRDLVWRRSVVAIDGARNQITLDAPITTAIEARYGGAVVTKVAGEPIQRLGVERLLLESAFDHANLKDEEHAWIAVQLDNVEDAWVRSVTARHFVGSAVRVGAGARRVTVEDCHSKAPVSEEGGYRRQSFLVEGGQVLVRRCSAEAGLNDFAVGMCAPGPNVFRDCVARGALGASGSFESWASGSLYERVRIEGDKLRLSCYDWRSQGGGWTAANSIVRDCAATEIQVAGPPDAPVIYDARKTRSAPLARTLPKDRPTRLPLFSLKKPLAEKSSPAPLHPVAIVGGRFVVDGRVLWGGQLNGAWWKGQVSAPIAVAIGGRSITRFVPGRTGPGLTEDLAELADDMIEAGTPFYSGAPGLWYDRRRDDHLFLRRPNADVWAPFYEMPWARSGLWTAWDGLSAYDLTKFNPWYFRRLQDFARICSERGLVFYNSFYNTHNMLETLAHWVDYPWRPANNINSIGLPEPPPLDEHTTVHLAFQVYDISSLQKRSLHRALIRRQLDASADSPNVIHCVAFQFGGPLEFQRFFLDEVDRWERETKRDAKVALITSKDITDAILGDPARARLVDVIDMRYWERLADGTMWAPPGDRNRAFREMNAEQFGRAVDTPPDSTPLYMYRQVREYRDRFPDKAIVAWHGGAGPVPILMAGGAQALMRNPAAGQSQGAVADPAAVSAFVRKYLAGVLARMTPRDGWLSDPDRNWLLADDPVENLLFYSVEGSAFALDRDLGGPISAALWFDPKTGATKLARLGQRLHKGAIITKPDAQAWLLYVTLKR